MTLYQLIKLSAKLKMKPLAHQNRVAGKVMGSKPGQLVFHGLGSGKTFTSINSANVSGLPLIVIAPASLRENFRKEISKSGFMGKYEVMSYNEATRDMGKKSFQNKIARSLVVYDEVHNAGRTESARSQLLKILKPKKTLMLTGTPIRNYPHEMVPLMSGLGIEGAPDSTEAFDSMFIGTGDEKDNAIKRIISIVMGMKKEKRPKNLAKFKKMMEGRVDYHDAFNPRDYPNVKENVVKVPMDKRHLIAYDKMMNMDPLTKFKIEYNITPEKIEDKGMMSFMIGPRMAANTPSSMSVKIPYTDSSKIKKMVSDLIKAKKKDKKFKALTYSNFLDSGISGVAQALKDKKIKYEMFTGEMNDKQKKAAVEAFNKSTSNILLVSGAGSEGIDLKGTKMVQIMEPHWNNARINQTIGRAARFKSHAHLPKKDREVTVNKYVSTIPEKWWVKMLGFRNRMSADEMLYNLANKKDELNKPFLDALKRSGK